MFGFFSGDQVVGSGSGGVTLGSDLMVNRGLLLGRIGDCGDRGLSLSC